MRKPETLGPSASHSGAFAPVPMPIFPDLQDKVAVVTGASRGLGLEVARQFAASGMKVALSGRDETALQAAVDRLRAEGGRVLVCAADCTDEAALAQLRKRVNWEWGPVDVLAACAGGQGAPHPTDRIGWRDWCGIIDGNLTATFLTVQAFLPGMLERGRGSIVTMASSAGRQLSLASAAHAATKAGVVMLSAHLAREYGSRGVRVNCLAPSAIATERFLQSTSPEQRETLAAQFPLGRVGLPADVAHAALYFASEASGWVTGVTLDITGGRVGG